VWLQLALELENAELFLRAHPLERCIRIDGHALVQLVAFDKEREAREKEEKRGKRKRREGKEREEREKGEKRGKRKRREGREKKRGKRKVQRGKKEERKSRWGPKGPGGRHPYENIFFFISLY